MKGEGEHDDLTAARLRKLEAIRQLGLDIFPRKYRRTHPSRQVVADFAQLEGQVVRTRRPECRADALAILPRRGVYYSRLLR